MRKIIAAATLASLACSAGGASICGDNSVVSALNGGSDAPVYLGLAADQAAAVVQVIEEDRDGQIAAACSGTLIAGEWVLSAGHCAADVSRVRRVLVVEPDGSVTASVGVDQSVVHEDLDLALLHLDGTLANVSPIPPAPRIPTDFDHAILQLGGTGYSDSSGPGRRMFSVETVVSIESTGFTVSADGYAGACDGDSGGPALTRLEDGTVAVVGVLSVGSVSCWGVDEYVRVDAAVAWLAANVAATESPTAGCGTLDDAGRCFGTLATWCTSGQLQAESCVGGRSCGWDVRAGGYRCVDPDADPCHGYTGFGACDSGDAVRCDGGTLLRNTCASCGADCVRSPRTGDVTCAAKAR
jgi:hypothetical protein